MDKNTRDRLIFVGIVGIFIVPMLLAWAVYRLQMVPASTINHGQLLSPPLSINDLHIQNLPANSLHQWRLIYVTPSACDDACAKHIHLLRQIRVALNADSSRVERLVLIQSLQQPTDLALKLTRYYPGTITAIIPKAPGKNVALNRGFMYVADPIGNIVLAYSPTSDPEGVLNDLKLLLRASQIG